MHSGYLNTVGNILGIGGNAIQFTPFETYLVGVSGNTNMHLTSSVNYMALPIDFEDAPSDQRLINMQDGWIAAVSNITWSYNPTMQGYHFTGAGNAVNNDDTPNYGQTRNYANLTNLSATMLTTTDTNQVKTLIGQYTPTNLATILASDIVIRNDTGTVDLTSGTLLVKSPIQPTEAANRNWVLGLLGGGGPTNAPSTQYTTNATFVISNATSYSFGMNLPYNRSTFEELLMFQPVTNEMPNNFSLDVEFYTRSNRACADRRFWSTWQTYGQILTVATPQGSVTCTVPDASGFYIGDYLRFGGPITNGFCFVNGITGNVLYLSTTSSIPLVVGDGVSRTLRMRGGFCDKDNLNTLWGRVTVTNGTSRLLPFAVSVESIQR
jgi:hypothetical protein